MPKNKSSLHDWEKTPGIYKKTKEKKQVIKKPMPKKGLLNYKSP